MKTFSFQQFIKMFLISIFYDFCRISTHYSHGRDIFYHHRPNCDNSTLTYMHITGDGYICSQPYKIINNNCLMRIKIPIWNCFAMIIIMTSKHYFTITS